MKMRIRVPYGIASSHRLGSLSAITDGQAYAPTFIAGDALITQDDGTGTDQADNIPTVVDTTNILWTISAAEATRPTSAGNKRLLQLYDQSTKAWFDLDVAIDFEEDGAIDFGQAAAIANGSITLRSGHGVSVVGSVLVTLLQGTDAKGKSRVVSYSGAGDVFTAARPWNEAGEALPSGTIIYRVDPVPPAAASELSAIATALLDLTDGVETGLTLRNALRDLAAVVLGEAALQSGTAPTFKSLDVSAGTVQSTKTRVTGASVDAFGNRGKAVLDHS